MCFSSRLVHRAGILLGVSAAAIVLMASIRPALAQTTAAEEKWTVTTADSKRGHAGKPYFIEFRGRAAANYGHLYVLYGRVNAHDEIISSRIAGLHPAGDAADCYNCSLLNWTIGHLIPVPSETGASDGDLEEKYVTARYRIWLTAAQFKDIDAYIRKLQADNPTWNALFNNCVEFGRSIASHMGLKLPAFVWLEPENFVNDLRELNGGPKTEQLPLKDAAKSTPVREASHAQSLPQEKPKVQPASDQAPAAKPAVKPKKPVASAKKPQHEAQTDSSASSTLASIFSRPQKMTDGLGDH
ncbi:MAG TPA: hypothetical protein VFA57_04970 [Pseudolabrys sp.]|nr:hypothetical protein [Pseudolabrys sp.]